jgi:hypothetical protein
MLPPMDGKRKDWNRRALPLLMQMRKAQILG